MEQSHDELSRITGIRFTNVATRAIVFNGINVEYAGSDPYRFAWKGLRIDASSVVAPYHHFGININQNIRNFTYVFGLEASLDESKIFEDDFAIESMSTAKGLRMINQGLIAGVSMIKITSANVGIIDTLNVSNETKTRYYTAIANGNTVYTPTKPFTYKNWTGLLSITLDKDGFGSYLIGEGLNGGYTVEEFLALVQSWFKSGLIAKAGLAHEMERINRLAVDLAVSARNAEKSQRPVFVAACMTTLEDCYRPDLVPPPAVCAAEHTEQAELLAQTPIDFFLLETFNTIAEAEIAADAVAKTGKPFAVSFTARADGNILNGDRWSDALTRLEKLSPLAILVNCVPPAIATQALRFLTPNAKAKNIPFGVYANGEGEAGGDEGWNPSKSGSSIDAYTEACKEWHALGAAIIGGCCGTTPEYTRRYAMIADEKNGFS